MENNVVIREPGEVGPRRSASTGRRHSSSRELILRLVEAQRAPVSLAALVRSSGLHENTVRGHLGQLLEDGYVARGPAPAEGRGRPAWLWRPVRAESSSAYAELAGTLAEALAEACPEPAEIARDAGRRWGRQLAAGLEPEPEPEGASAPPDERRAVIAVMADQGFDPEDTGEEIALRRCPLLEAATRSTEVVCAVHRGMVDGVLEHLGSDPGERVDLQPFAGPGRCALHLRATA
ncbi:helix-turn-helix transcriptional regulator [Brachybacterium sp. DNPG3]